MEVVRTATYAKGLKRLFKLGASEADVLTMENAVALTPEAGDLVPGSGGLRKIRFGYGSSGKRGGGRTIYYIVRGERVILLVTYAKVDRQDVPADVLRRLATLAKEMD